jgi:type IV pilus assembly protein PilZ
MNLARGGAIIQTNLHNEAVLHASYLPFVVGGGLFVASQQAVKLGQEVLVIATLLEQPNKYALKSKVIWIAPKPNGSKPQGFAIQLIGEKGLEFKLHVEQILLGLSHSLKPTYTM